MTIKSNLLIITDYNRKDYVDLFYACRDYFNFYFIYHTSQQQLRNDYFKTYGKCLFWKDYKDVFELLDTIRPAKVVFFYIEAFNHVALNIACKEKGIPTYLLEHGLRADYVVGFDRSISKTPPETILHKIKRRVQLLRQAPFRIKEKRFLLNSMKRFTAEDAAFTRNFIKTRKKHNFLETFKQLPSGKRTADYYISFSPKVYQVHQQHDALTPEQQVYFIGVPYFDDLAHIKTGKLQRAILFIDQPLAEHHLLQWTAEYKKTFVKELMAIVTAHDYTLYVKPHPIQNISPWQSSGKAIIIDDKRLREICSNVPLVMGFYSTYLMPLAAMPHTALITFENHPAGKLHVSKPFTEAGVARAVYDVEELKELLPVIKQLHQQQLPNKARFIQNWLYKFDGNSGNRLRDILLSTSETTSNTGHGKG